MAQNNITVDFLGEEIYSRYPGQTKPQSLFIELDPVERRVSAYADPEIGTAVPEEVHNGRLLRFYLSSPYSSAAWINKKMRELAPLFGRVCDGYREERDGSTRVGILSEDAGKAERKIEEILDEPPEADEELLVWDPEEFFELVRDEAEDEVREALKAGRDPKKALEEFADVVPEDLFDPDLGSFVEKIAEKIKEE